MIFSPVCQNQIHPFGRDDRDRQGSGLHLSVRHPDMLVAVGLPLRSGLRLLNRLGK